MGDIMEENMNVEVLKTLYNREKEKLKELKEMLDKVRRKKELCANDLKDISVEYNGCKMDLEEIESDQDNLYNKYRKLLLVIDCVIFVIYGILILISFLGVLTFDILFFIKVIKSITDIDKMIFWCVGLSFVTAGVEVFIGKKLIKFLENIFENIMCKIEDLFVEKVENSKLYKELVFLESVALEKSERVKLERDKVQQNKDTLSTKYDYLKKEYDDKKGIVDYLDRQINPIETTLNLNRELKPNHDSSNKTKD